MTRVLVNLITPSTKPSFYVQNFTLYYVKTSITIKHDHSRN